MRRPLPDAIFAGYMETFVVSARKYRPRTFDEVIGQEHISSTLKNALTTGHLAHAFLFTGPRGVGKTTCARILAKVINCENPVDKHTPCNECTSCKAFNENASFNILELDAASNNSVDNIRSLTEQVRFQPQGGKYKVFIIDEVHMLSSSAFNAFLKTLEEPPPHAIFILATTEKHKIIPTILSRCQIFDFRRIRNADIIQNLVAICEKEQIEYEADALHIIAEKADGAMRDALSIFDRIVSSVNNQISYQKVIANLNVLDYDYYFRIIDAILAEDLGQTLLIHDEISKNGFEGQVFINGMAEHLRQLMVCKDPQTLILLETSDRLKERYQEQAQKSSLSFILNALHLANQCDIDFQRAQNKLLHVEIALSKMVFMHRKVSAIGEEGSKKKPDTELTSSPAPQNSQKKPASEKKKEPDPAAPHSSTGSTPEKKPATPRISRLSKLKQEVIRELDEDRKTDRDFSLQDIEQIVNQYIDHLSSPYVIRVLKELQFALNEKTIFIYVPSELTENMVREEISLMEQIRDRLPGTDYQIRFEVDPDRFPEYEELQPKKILTNKEKFELFQEKNPLMSKLVEVFDLKIDAE